MKIDLSKNKKSNNNDENKKESPIEKLKGKPAQKDDEKSAIQQAIEEKVPFIAVLTERFSLKTIAIGAGTILFILIALIGRIFGGSGEEEGYLDDLDNAPQEVVEVEGDTETEQPTDEENPPPPRGAHRRRRVDVRMAPRTVRVECVCRGFSRQATLLQQGTEPRTHETPSGARVAS